MKLVVDIGTHKYNLENTLLLLHHFFEWYDNLGVSYYHVHGNIDLIESVKQIYCRGDITYHSITVDDYNKYKQQDRELCIEQNNLGDDRVLRTSRKLGKNPCPLWIIQNDIKEKYITENELCFVLDLDEFVDVDINSIDGDIDYIRGDVYDMFGGNGLLPKLSNDEPIIQQLHTPVKFQQASKRPCRKVVIMRSGIRHCYGHHNLLEMKHNYTQTKIPAKVYHMKWFHQNVEYLKTCPHARKEMRLLQFGEDIHVLPKVWNMLTKY
jgi:hypothetical protein